TNEDPRVLLKQGRDLYNGGKLDDAAKVAQRARVAGASTSWGLFEDSPEKLLRDVEKARTKRDQEESVKVLVEGRKLLEKGDLDGAEKAAYKAQDLQGPYSVWDLGDRPQKLMAEVEPSRAKQRKVDVPPVPPAAIAKKDDGARPGAGAGAANSTPKPGAGAAP